MKTSHQFAQELLAGPDVPIVVASSSGHCKTPYDSAAASLGSGYDSANGGEVQEFIEVHSLGDGPVYADKNDKIA